MKARKVGKNKGIARIWLEGPELSNNGIVHGLRFNVTIFATGGIAIVIDPNGKRKIAGKPGRPIVDMTGATVADAGFAIGDLFEIIKTSNGIIVDKINP